MRGKMKSGGKRKKTADTETGTKQVLATDLLIVGRYIHTSRPEMWQLEIMIMINHDVHIYYVSD